MLLTYELAIGDVREILAAVISAVITSSLVGEDCTLFDKDASSRTK